MGYTALEAMQKQLNTKFGCDLGPNIPKIATKEKSGSLAWCALTFLRENCEGLRFNTAESFAPDKMNEIRTFTDRLGSSYSQNQIPYYMQMDIDRLCLERTLGDFLITGTTQAAYLVYYCYLEMFWSGTESGEVRRMIEQLSEFEKNSSPLLASHRDHFVHSVYVFAIGLAVYQQSPLFREAYQERYKDDFDGISPAHHFLKYWGFAALFHDMGYPFELSFNQVQDYFKSQNTPAFHSCYQKGPEYLKDQTEKGYEQFYQAIAPKDPMYSFGAPQTADELFAILLTERLYCAFQNSTDYQDSLGSEKDTPEAFYRYLKMVLEKKPTDPVSFKNNMDHAYFSAYLVLHHLGHPNSGTIPKSAKETMDALAAILLHNSLIKYTILDKDRGVEGKIRLEMQPQPLTYLLMLCDDLQCWNRYGYGKKNRQENDPIDCCLVFHENTIDARYLFDVERILDKKGTIEKFSGTSKPYRFLKNIKDYLQINDDSPKTLKLNVGMDLIDHPPIKGEPLSECSFLNTYQLAAQLNAEYQSRDGYNETDTSRPHLKKDASEEERLRAFEGLSLEYKLANFYQVQQFADHLNRIGCFFTDREVAFPELEKFSANQLKEIGKWEHEAWARRKRAMGWCHGQRYSELGKTEAEKYNLRECMREHQYLNEAFKKLPAEKKIKDMIPIQNFKFYMKKNYQVRIYSLK